MLFTLFLLISWLYIGQSQTIGQINNSIATTTTVATKPTYNIGISFPKSSDVVAEDPALKDMIVTSEVAIQLAADSIRKSNILSDVELNFTRYYSDEKNPGKTSLTAVKMVQDNVNAVIGDMISTMTEAIASVTGVKQIPQCSCASASYSLTDKSIYPYFFRTVGSVSLYGESLVDWVDSMGWGMFAIIYTNDAVGQQVLNTMKQQANKHKIQAMTNIPLYSLTDEEIEESLSLLESSGSRIVILADSTTSDQVAILNKARHMGLLTKGWVWIVTNDISPVLQENAKTPEDLAVYDGLMFISGLWDLTGEPSYDRLNQIWKDQRVPEEFSDAREWNTTGLSYNAPQAYACAELLALGLNHALDTYPGGRSVGLSDLGKGTFNSSRMTPEFYNLNYTGPAGLMNFSDTGDLESGYFQILYMLNGTSVPYATVKLNHFEFMPNTSIIYLGHTTEKPADMVAKSSLNPTTHEATGVIIITICAFGLLAALLMMFLIIWFRGLKSIMVASPIFCCLQLTGLSLTYVAVALYIEKPSPAKCIFRQVFLMIGFVLVIGSIVAKNYRIYRIFQNVFTVRTSRLKSYYLVRIVAFFGIIGLLPLIIWYAIFPISVSDVMISTSSYCWLCTYPTAKVGSWHNFNIAELIALIWCVILMVISALLAFKTRNVGSKWSEATQIAYVSYNTGLAAIVASPSFFLANESYLISTYLKIASILFAATFTIIVLFLPKFILIVSYIFKSNKKLSLYRMNTESQAQLTHQPFSSSPDDSLNLNLVAKNMFDFTVKAHEGILPVKKMARFEFLSIWELKHIVLVPLKRFFILSSKSGHSAILYNYTHCEMINTHNKDHYVFRVRTDDGLTFMFQVSDQTALERWINWFNGRDDQPVEPPKRSNTQIRFVEKPRQETDGSTGGSHGMSSSEIYGRDQPRLMEPAHPKNQLETFGVDDHVSSIVNNRTFYLHTSDFYDPTSFSDVNNQFPNVANNPVLSSSYNRTISMSASENVSHNNMSITLPNSFGVIDPSWRQYP